MSLRDLFPERTPEEQWARLRWQATTSQLRELARGLGVDISDIPENTQMKKKIATRIADRVRIPVEARA